MCIHSYTTGLLYSLKSDTATGRGQEEQTASGLLYLRDNKQGSDKRNLVLLFVVRAAQTRRTKNKRGNKKKKKSLFDSLLCRNAYTGTPRVIKMGSKKKKKTIFYPRKEGKNVFFFFFFIRKSAGIRRLFAKRFEKNIIVFFVYVFRSNITS